VSQRPRLSTEACDLAEEAHDQAEDTADYWRLVWEDGRIDGEEIYGMTLRLAETAAKTGDTVVVASKVDESVAEMVAGIRCGFDSPRVTRLRTERRLRNERAA